MYREHWILDDFASALDRLQEALDPPATEDLIKAGCIQYFELCFELGWKSIKAVGATHGLEECLSPRSCLKQAFAQGWIDDETIWLEMLDARDRMSHTYDSARALEVYASLGAFLACLRTLRERLQAAMD